MNYFRVLHAVFRSIEYLIQQMQQRERVKSAKLEQVAIDIGQMTRFFRTSMSGLSASRASSLLARLQRKKAFDIPPFFLLLYDSNIRRFLCSSSAHISSFRFHLTFIRLPPRTAKKSKFEIC